MKIYAELDKQLKQLEEDKKTIRKLVLDDFTANPDLKFNGIIFTTSDKITFNDEAFFNWIKTEFPGSLEDCRADKIDYERFEKLVDEGFIKYDELPRDIYNLTPIQTIRVIKIK